MPEDTPPPSGDAAHPGDLHPDLQRYHEQHEGLTRGELSKDDPALYQRLRRAGLLEQIPRKGLSDIPDLLAYYREHYEGLTRWQLFKRDQALYQRLRRAGLLEKIPTTRP